ncbi:MAG: ATPase, T2SS/T4P/T4SS family, partial [Leptotrichiaceae bacterium]
MNKIKLENKLEETQASVLYGRNSLFYVETIIGNAINSKASDIHLNILDLNSSEKELQISYRIDGILVKDKFIHEKFGKQKINQNASEIISRIKILSGMNVAEKRLPQDGSISYEHNKSNWDIRVATLPAISGESIVIRILGNTLESVSLESLGFSKVNEQKIEKILQKKFGLILITGPTGSGKSTTMTTMINMLDIEHKKIIKVEDPVESRINGVTQIQINEKIGLNFSEVLRSSLRNDPDVIVISEIRDEETAEIAIRAALT